MCNGSGATRPSLQIASGLLTNPRGVKGFHSYAHSSVGTDLASLGEGHRAIPYVIQRALAWGLCLISLIYQPIILIYRRSRTHRFRLDCGNALRWCGKSMRCEFSEKRQASDLCPTLWTARTSEHSITSQRRDPRTVGLDSCVPSPFGCATQDTRQRYPTVEHRFKPPPIPERVAFNATLFEATAPNASPIPIGA